MISALGAGIGKEEFDLAKLRYHKLIIMCDADVDGSHIRTLILTFFFRQMLEIVQNGHLYIAQPPLYKISEGKKETYLKDDREYRSFLVERIQGNRKIRLGDREMEGEALAVFIESMESFRDKIERLVSRGFPEGALVVALSMGVVDKESLADDETVKGVAARLAEESFSSVEVGDDEEHGTATIGFVSRRDGVERGSRIDWNLLTSAEYRFLANNADGLEALRDGGLVVISQSGEEERFERIDEMLDHLYSSAKKGLSIQRYKGLGEMNAEQLWETTMDPERRRLLQVTIEDDVAADMIFATLMGDHVEPRREFIEANALDVRNLDI